MIEFHWKFENRGIKIAWVNSILINKSINLQLFTLIFCGVGVCCDQRKFSVLSPFIVKNIKYFGPTHAHGGTLDLLMTDVPNLVRVFVVAPIGNSDHSSLSAVISTAQAVPNLCVKESFP